MVFVFVFRSCLTPGMRAGSGTTNGKAQLWGFAFRRRVLRSFSGLKSGLASGGDCVCNIIWPLTQYATCRRRVACTCALHCARGCCCERVADARACTFMSRRLLCDCGAIARRSRKATNNVNGSRRRQSTCNETGYLHCLRCKPSYVEGCVHRAKCDVRPFHIRNKYPRGVFFSVCFSCVWRGLYAWTRIRSHGKLCGRSARRQQNVAA